MADQGKRTDALPDKTGLVSANDRVVVLYGANSSVAQTALIPLRNLLANTANLQVVAANLVLSDIRSNPANSTALTIAQGTLFFSSTFGYFAIANNTLVRWAVSSF